MLYQPGDHTSLRIYNSKLSETRLYLQANGQYRPKLGCPPLPQEILRVGFYTYVLQTYCPSRICFPKVRLPTNTGSGLTSSMSFYWGLVGMLIPFTLYCPAYSAASLKGSFLNSTNWLLGWTVFILVRFLMLG